MSNIALTPREEAYITHNRIMTNGKVLQTALYEVCKDLKQMKDKKLYTELGYSSFEDYAEQACGIKQRQAYSYISAYEKLGESFLKENASFGITKLELISQISSYERDEFLSENDVETLSTRDLKAKVEEYKKQNEQLTFESAELNERLDEISRQNLEMGKELQTLKGELDEERKSKEIVVEPSADNDDVEKRLEEQRKKYEAKIEKNLKAAAKKEKETANAAAKEARKLALEEANEKMEKLLREKQLSDEKLEKALKEAKLQNADPDAVAIRFLFSNLQSTANTIGAHLASLRAKDWEQADKLTAGLVTVLENVIKAVKEGE